MTLSPAPDLAANSDRMDDVDAVHLAGKLAVVNTTVVAIVGSFQGYNFVDYSCCLSCVRVANSRWLPITRLIQISDPSPGNGARIGIKCEKMSIRKL